MDHVFQIVTAFVAVYGAILSTLNALASRREKRRTARAEIKMGFLVMGNVLGRSQIFISVSNPGYQPIVITSACIELPDGSNIVMPSSQGTQLLPYKLHPSEGATFWADAQNVALSLREKGRSGTLRIRAYFSDAVGNCFRSKRMRFQVDDWLEEQSK